MSTKKLCNTCAHYWGDFKCDAFPVQIPDNVLTGTNDHEKPIDGQEGDAVYQPINVEIPPDANV